MTYTQKRLRNEYEQDVSHKSDVVEIAFSYKQDDIIEEPYGLYEDIEEFELTNDCDMFAII